MRPATLNTIRAVSALFLTVIFPLIAINSERLRLENARKLESVGQKTTAELKELIIERRRAYMIIPLGETYKVEYRFTVNGRSITNTHEIDDKQLGLYSPDGQHFRPGSPVPLVYLPSDPAVSMPESELAGSHTVRWGHLLYVSFCLIFTGIVIDFRLRNIFGLRAVKAAGAISDRELRETLLARREKEVQRRMARGPGQSSVRQDKPAATQSSAPRAAFGLRR